MLVAPYVLVDHEVLCVMYTHWGKSSRILVAWPSSKHCFLGPLSIEDLALCWIDQMYKPQWMHVCIFNLFLDVARVNTSLKRRYLHCPRPYYYYYVCMYVCMYTCMYTCMYVCVRRCMCACMYVCMYIMYALCIYVCIICMQWGVTIVKVLPVEWILSRSVIRCLTLNGITWPAYKTCWSHWSIYRILMNRLLRYVFLPDLTYGRGVGWLCRECVIATLYKYSSLLNGKKDKWQREKKWGKGETGPKIVWS